MKLLAGLGIVFAILIAKEAINCAAWRVANRMELGE